MVVDLDVKPLPGVSLLTHVKLVAGILRRRRRAFYAKKIRRLYIKAVDDRVSEDFALAIA